MNGLTGGHSITIEKRALVLSGIVKNSWGLHIGNVSLYKNVEYFLSDMAENNSDILRRL